MTFDIDANGIVNVSAKDLGTGKQKQITITARSKLSEDEIEQAIRDAQAFAGEDTSRKRHWDVLNDAQNAALGAEQYLNQNKKTLSREDKRNIKGEIAAMQKLIRGKKPEKMSDQEADYIEAQAGRLKSHDRTEFRKLTEYSAGTRKTTLAFPRFLLYDGTQKI